MEHDAVYFTFVCQYYDSTDKITKAFIATLWLYQGRSQDFFRGAQFSNSLHTPPPAHPQLSFFLRGHYVVYIFKVLGNKMKRFAFSLIVCLESLK